MTTGAQIINEVLTSAAGVTVLVSGRIYLYQAPQDVQLPCITFFQITSDPNNTLSGPSAVTRERWQIDCWSDRYSGAISLAASVKAAMLASVGDNDLDSVVLLSELAQFEREEALHRVILDFSIWHT